VTHARASLMRRVLPYGRATEAIAIDPTQDPKLPPADRIRKMRRKALRALIRDYIEFAERGGADQTGGDVAAIVRAQYVTQELTRRTQNWQTGTIIFMTAVFTLRTGVVMIAAICPQCVSAATWLFNLASQWSHG